MKTQALTNVPARYIPSLDGWRALAILAVMALHDRLHQIGRLNDSWPNAHGVLGCRVFSNSHPSAGLAASPTAFISGSRFSSRSTSPRRKQLPGPTTTTSTGRSLSCAQLLATICSSDLSSASATNSPVTPSPGVREISIRPLCPVPPPPLPSQFTAAGPRIASLRICGSNTL